MHVDIILLGILALLIFVRLLYVLGRHRDIEKEKVYRRILEQLASGGKQRGEESVLAPKESQEGKPPKIVAIEGNGEPYITLRRIQALDPAFNLPAFKTRAEDMFEEILAAFSKRYKLELSASLLGKDVYEDLVQRVEKREEIGKVREHVLYGFNKVEIVSAKLVDKVASVVVSFESEQSNVMVSEEKKSSSRRKPSLKIFHDLWTFERNYAEELTSQWRVVAVREE